MLDQIVTMGSGVLPHPPDQAAEQAATRKVPTWPHQGQGAGQQEQGDSLGLFWLQEPIYTTHQLGAQGVHGERQLHNGCPGKVLKVFTQKRPALGTVGDCRFH
jgi:hypothetical protein